MTSIVEKSDRQKEAEADVKAVKEGLGPFVVAAEVTRMAMVFTDATVPGNPIIFANDAFVALTGYDREEVLGQDFNFLMVDGADDVARSKIRDEFTGSTGGTEVCYRRKNGSSFWAAVIVSPVRDENGEIIQHFASFVDLTKHLDEQSQLRMLVEELNHRVKNTLATVQAIVVQGLRSAVEPRLVAEAIQSRLYALSRSHDLLTRENWKSAGLRDLISDALEPFEAEKDAARRLIITGQNIRFPPKSALALGIAFNELATNAVKYGALSNATGSIAIDWEIVGVHDAADRLILNWRETGGPAVRYPTRKGFGSNVIERGLAYELNGSVKMDYRVEGLVCMIDVPAPEDSRYG
ncbi:MAG: Blue-light-activated histidine kinase 1 [Rhizobium sp.]|nr:Blue-light-activated histidine kinase 1 [Rhizobium sp.]